MLLALGSFAAALLKVPFTDFFLDSQASHVKLQLDAAGGARRRTGDRGRGRCIVSIPAFQPGKLEVSGKCVVSVEIERIFHLDVGGHDIFHIGLSFPGFKSSSWLIKKEMPDINNVFRDQRTNVDNAG